MIRTSDRHNESILIFPQDFKPNREHAFFFPNRVTEHAILLYLQNATKNNNGCVIVPDKTVISEILYSRNTEMAADININKIVEMINESDITGDPSLEIILVSLSDSTFEVIFNMIVDKAKQKKTRQIRKTLMTQIPEFDESKIINSLDWYQSEYNKNDGSFKEDNQENDLKMFFDKFKKCQLSGSRYILFNFGIYCKDENNDYFSHSNFAIYDTKEKLLERYDPHGGYQGYPPNNKLCIYAPEIDRDLIAIFRKKEIELNYYFKPSDICQFGEGLQFSEDNLVSSDPGGYCLIWSVLYAELRLLNPNIERSRINELARTQLSSRYEDIMSYIRGYANHILFTTSKMFTEQCGSVDPAHRHILEHKLFYNDGDSDDTDEDVTIGSDSHIQYKRSTLELIDSAFYFRKLFIQYVIDEDRQGVINTWEQIDNDNLKNRVVSRLLPVFLCAIHKYLVDDKHEFLKHVSIYYTESYINENIIPPCDYTPFVSMQRDSM